MQNTRNISLVNFCLLYGRHLRRLLWVRPSDLVPTVLGVPDLPRYKIGPFLSRIKSVSHTMPLMVGARRYWYLQRDSCFCIMAASLQVKISQVEKYIKPL